MTSIGRAASAGRSLAASTGGGAASRDVSLDITHCEGFKYLEWQEQKLRPQPQLEAGLCLAMLVWTQLIVEDSNT